MKTGTVLIAAFVGGVLIGLSVFAIAMDANKSTEIPGYSRTLVCEDFTLVQWAGTDRWTLTHEHD